MMKVKDGYKKLIGTSYSGSANNLLLSNGGDTPLTSLFTTLTNDNNQISITVGGTTKKLSVAYATKASLDANGNVINNTYATQSSLNDFVTLTTNQEITGIKTFSNSTHFDNYVHINHKLSGGANIVFKNLRQKAGGGGWADEIISYRDDAGNQISRLGVFGSAENLSYMYLGTNDYDGLNLRLSSNSASFGNNNLYKEYLYINTAGAGGNNFSENYTKPYTNKALVVGPISDGTTALYINRGGILAWNTTSDTPKTSNGTVTIPGLNILGAGGVTYFGGDVTPKSDLTLSLGASSVRWKYFNGMRIGQSNNSVFVTAKFPRYSEEAIREFYKDGYTYTSGTTPSAEQYFKALCRWAINTYEGKTNYTDDVITLIGQAAPGYIGTLILSLYTKTGKDETGLPKYCSGEFISLDFYKMYFSCNGFQTDTTKSNWRFSSYDETKRGNIAQIVYGSGNVEYPILGSCSTANENKIGHTYFDSAVTINPYKNSVTATSFVGALHSPSSKYAYAEKSLVYLAGQFSKSSTTLPAILGSDATYQKVSCPSHLYTSGDLVNIMSLRLVWSDKYWHEIYCDPNNETMWHRNIQAGSAKPWKAILDQTNYTNYFKGLVETYLTASTSTNLPNKIPSTGFYSIHNYSNRDLWVSLFPEIEYGRVIQFGGNGYGTGLLAWTYNHLKSLGYSITGNLYWRSGDPGRNTESVNYWEKTSWKLIAFLENCVKSNVDLLFKDSSDGYELLDNARVLALTGGLSLTKSKWSYAYNGYITATKPDGTTLANLDLAGASVLTFGNTSAYTQLFITAPVQAGHNGISNEMLFYLNHGSSYSPGWTRVLTNRNYKSILDSVYLSINGTATSAYSATLLKSSGRMSTMLTGTNKPSNSGLTLNECYNLTGAPVSYGNILLIQGNVAKGCGELLCEWTSSDTTGHLYYRSLRDTTNSWSAWKQLAFSNDVLKYQEFTTSPDANTLTQNGIYNSKASITNAPVTNWGYLLTIAHTYYAMLTYWSDSGSDMYIRRVGVADSSKTTGWKRLLHSGDSDVYVNTNKFCGYTTANNTDTRYYCICETNLPTGNNVTLSFYISRTHGDSKQKGILQVHFRNNSGNLALHDWSMPLNIGLNKNDFILTYKVGTDSTLILKLYVTITGSWKSYECSVLTNSSWGAAKNFTKFYSSNNSNSLTSLPSDETRVTNTISDCSTSAYILTLYKDNTTFYNGYQAWFKWIDTTTLGLKIGDVNNNATSTYKFQADLAGSAFNVYLNNSGGNGNFPLIFTNTAVAGTPLHNPLYTASTNTLYYNPANTLLTVPKISLATTGQLWISGKNHTSPAINISTKQTEKAYHPILNVETYNGHFVSLGGINNEFGFYGYNASLTDNGTSWRTYWDVGTGRLTHVGNIYSIGFYQTSDATLKIFKDDIKIDFNKLKSIPKKYFYWKSDDMCKLLIGTSAQEVLKLYPELVSSNDGILSVAYDKLSILALKSIDELYEMIINLKSENEELRNKINALNN